MAASRKPILIVNADDLGWNREATDLAIEAFQAGQISSSTVLMDMEDSRRAAELAREHGLPTGLHLNLSDPLTDPELPAARRERHDEVRRYFAAGRELHLRSWTFDPRIQRAVTYAVEAQLERYLELFGEPPSHVDGHNHVHVCPNPALAKPLAGLKRRNALWGWPGKRSAMGAARTLRRLLTTPRALTTSYFLDISELPHDPAELHAALEISRQTSVEVMCHPGFDHERDALESPYWGPALNGFPLGSYRDLA